MRIPNIGVGVRVGAGAVEFQLNPTDLQLSHDPYPTRLDYIQTVSSLPVGRCE